MKLCPKCVAVACCCDFCKHYEFNGDTKGQYTGDGYCKLHKIYEDPDGGCDDFHCKDLKEKKKRQFTKK